jgi:hypothetical protein
LELLRKILDFFWTLPARHDLVQDLEHILTELSLSLELIIGHFISFKSFHSSIHLGQGVLLVHQDDMVVMHHIGILFEKSFKVLYFRFKIQLVSSILDT